MSVKDEWQTEPDHEAFEAHGLRCLVLRHGTLKHLCGYVGIPKGHRYFGKEYDAVEFGGDDDWWPHGGLTYAQEAAPHEKPDGLWWFGFDCAHSGDFVPSMDKDMTYGTYRNFAYVRRDTERLAQELARPVQ